MSEPEDLSHLSITPEQFFELVERQENQVLDAANSDVFRAVFGDELADEVAELSRESLAKLDETRRVWTEKEGDGDGVVGT